MEAKNNEITSIPELLNLMDLKKSFITIDAMGCQKDITSKIKDKKQVIFWQYKAIRESYIIYLRKKSL